MPIGRFQLRARRSLTRVLGRGRGANRVPCLPCDAKDERGDREADDRVSARDANRYERGGDDDSERHVAIDACVVTIGDQRRTVEPRARAQPDLRGDFVPDEADRSGDRENREVGEIARVNQPIRRLDRGHRCGCEDRQHDGVTGPTLAPLTAEPERDAERNGGQRVTAVVDQVGKQRDRVRSGEDDRLQGRSPGEDGKTPGNGANPFTRTNDGRVDPSMCMPVIVVVMAVVGRLVRPKWEARVAVRPVVMVFVGPQSMTMFERAVHSARMPDGTRWRVPSERCAASTLGAPLTLCNHSVK